MNLSSLIDQPVLEEAWAWLCRRRRNYPASSDIWWLRRDWAVEKPRLCQEISSGQYQFEPLQKLTRSDGEVIELWTARDALVLKAMAIVLGQTFEVSPQCTHVKGHGGAKAAVRQVSEVLPEYRFVFRTDVKSFYASIDHLTADKTFIGYIERGFDFLGYQFSPEGLRVAQSTLNNFLAKATRLYEQSPSAPEGAERVGCYVKRWLCWVHSAAPTISIASHHIGYFKPV